MKAHEPESGPADPAQAASAADSAPAAAHRPQTPAIWQGPGWALALLLSALSMIGPFAVDTYLPAFGAMAADLHASPAQMQQTLAVYLFAFAAMNLFHGALSDSLGRRPVVLLGLSVFGLASVACALAGDLATLLLCRALQGASAGAGMTVARAVIRDVYAPASAQRVMSQVSLFFGLAPAVAPLVGAWLLVGLGWRAIFWFLAAVSLLVVCAHARFLPESLPPARRQPLSPAGLLRGYASLLRKPRFLPLVAASSLPFNAYFLYILSAPAFLGEGLGLVPTQYFWFFLIGIAGMMFGAWSSGRLAGRIAPARQAALGFLLMGLAAALNVAVNLWLAPQFLLCTLPLALLAMGSGLLMPIVTILVLDTAPERRGTASSLQGCIGSIFNGLVAGVLSPAVMHSRLGLALASALLWALGAMAWRLAQHHSLKS